MECIVQFSSAKKIASGKLKAEATVIHRPSKVIAGSGFVKALATIDITVGFTQPQQQNFGASNENNNELFGASPAPVFAATNSRNIFSCVSKLRVLDSLHIKTPNNTNTYQISSTSDIYDSIQSSNRIIKIVNPYSDINPQLSNKEENCGLSAFIMLSKSNLSAKFTSIGKFVNSYVDKIGGTLDQILSIKNFRSTQKLYPIRDINIESSGVYFVNKELSSGNIYESINEGLFLGNYVENSNQSTRISDDVNSFIQPSSIHSEGDFNYKFEVTSPLITPKNSFLFIRAAAPMVSYESDVPAVYKIHNIKLEDPSGNLIVKYKDIVFKGDGDFLDESKNNFATYVTEPEVNYASLHTWESKFPIIGEASGYTLNLDFNVDCIHKPFSPNFNFGYENECKLEEKFVDSSSNDYLAIDGSPISTRSQGYVINPTNSLRISAIEIVNSGSLVGLLKENYLPFHAEVQPTGNRLERIIYPSKVMPYDFDTGVEPQVNSIWTSSDAYENTYYNTDSSGVDFLTTKLRDLFNFGYIELTSVPSGKLQLQFKHEPPFGIKQQAGGAFNFGSKTRTKGLNSSSYDIVYTNDSFFTIDSIELHITARKATDSPDYTIDVVGYSNDKVLNVTSAKGGFLQNLSGGQGDLPLYSGLNITDELAISAETLSDKDQYREYSTANDGGDHFLIATDPVVNSTDFKKYIVPLKIYEDPVTIGSSKDYSMSSYFETLYLDIFPLPSGAAIANANLVVKYKPSNAIPLYTFGYNEQEFSKRTVHIYPSPKKTNKDVLINTNWQQAPLSLIENIPHGYKYPITLKTNYSRRWRGVDGNIYDGPFDAIDFDFSFYNPQLDQPFLSGYFDFNNIENNTVLSSLEDINYISGIFNSDLNTSLIKNLGLRFNSESLFASQERTYKTIDWTESGHELYGHILDSFDNAVRVSGENGYFDFGEISTVSGFSIFTRFSPDATMSGVGYNLWNSGIIFAKWNESELEFAVGYNSGHLCAYAINTDDEIIYVEDPSDYTTYQYPLSILVTYNDNNSKKLKLYTDNEIASGQFDYLRDSSSEFDLKDSNAHLTVGYAEGGNVGVNAFITEVGISTYNSSGTSIVESNNNSRLQQTTVESFLSTHRAKFWNDDESYTNDRYNLWQFVDENTNDWYIGAFKYCNFYKAYDTLKERIGKDYIIHNFYSSGTTYQDITDLTLPSNINLSGIAYHSQIENDMLRFNLGGQTNSVYAVAPRINKALPRGYLFNEEGFVVDTVIQHETTNDIIWNDGKVGPKLIVSLYTKSKDSELFDSTNWGLINRSIHYINPDICWAKISSKFTLKDLIDTDSEPWSNFVTSRNITETNHKYFSKDLNEMFLQYDLVYPSGSYHSKIKLHSCHVRLENTLLKSEVNTSELYLAISGEQRPRETLSLSMPNTFDSISTLLDPNSGLSLYASGYLLVPSSGSMNIFTSGAYLLDNNTMSLYTTNVGYIGAPVFNDMFGATNDSLFGTNLLYGPTLYVAGRSSKYDDTTLALYLENDDTTPRQSETLVLYTHITPTQYNSSISLSVVGDFANNTFILNAFAPLYINAPTPDLISSANLPFFVYASNPYQTFSSGTMSLMTYNFTAINAGSNQLESFLWNKDNIGKDITVQDNYSAFLDANDEIRGVQTICYGECGSDVACEELAIVTHDTVWNEAGCIPGGAIRPLTVYTNPDVSGFKTPIGYSGNFYGIRKFDGLIPQAPYDITIVGKTGSEEIIDVPREMTEWEYGNTSIAKGDDEDLGYSGVKLISPNRDIDNQYGKSIAIHNNLLAVGAPGENIRDANNYLVQKAGSVYVYRRDVEPSGYDWSNQPDKSAWELETVLTLPSGYRRDYYTTSNAYFYDNGNQLPFYGVQKNWIVGQEGRELGYSVSASNDVGNNRKVIVAGAPGCKWTRTFGDVQPSSINVGLFIFTDEFQPEICADIYCRTYTTYQSILNAIRNKDILFKYFCDPAVSFNVKIIICEPVLGTSYTPSADFTNPKPTFIDKFQIHRHKIYNRTSSNFFSQNNTIFNDIKTVFDTVFPYDENKLHNNIPPILGFYVDNSISLGEKALQPALDQFIDYYENYSYASGLRDFNDSPATGYAVKSVSIDENWIDQSSSILDTVLNTGTMVANNVFTLFANNLGTFNPNISAFNVPPSSGGSVFIYEKSRGPWNLIQEIKSPTTSNTVAPDRFGHAVTISENGNIIVIGSPYINQAVSIYEYKPELANKKYDYFPSWLASKASSTGGEFTTLNTRLNNLLNSTSDVLLRESHVLITYFAMSDDAKFEFMQYMNNLVPHFNPYQLIKTVTYNDIRPRGSWDFFAEAYAPTSRLGYSVACNEDGSTVAIGAPTDSMGAQDNLNIWYKPGYDRNTQWQSYVNAGCVRLLESRNYYPHNKVVEYGKFGNLFELHSPVGDYPFFNHMETIYRNNFNLDYEKTSFAETEIPQDAGTLFIITPAVNAASDEIIDKIQDWLALGDRNLVLVGNDPKWEDNGLYANSNQIINYILERLDSRMRLYPARNKYESLIEKPSGLEFNVGPSYTPQRITSTYTSRNNLNGSGVADIKFYYPQANYTYFCDKTFTEINNSCKMPIVHSGDLRAAWNSICYTDAGYPVIYEENIGFYFGTSTIPCPGYPSLGINKPNYEPIPILAGIEKVKKTIYHPEIPAKTQINYVRQSLPGKTFYSTYNRFTSTPDSGLALLWSSDSGNYTYLNTNIGQNANASIFFDPAEYNDKDALLMAKSEVLSKILNEPYIISDKYYYAAEETYNNSKVILIAGTYSEAKEVLLSSTGDKNLNFYFNIVSKNEFGGANIAQLGGWTNRYSFKDGDRQSDLYSQLQLLGNYVTENVSSYDLSDISNDYDVAWIANTTSLPSDEDISRIKKWLNYGNKKLVITYGNDPSSLAYNSTYAINVANSVTYLCDKLDLSMKPLFLPNKNRYASIDDVIDRARPGVGASFLINKEYNPIYRGLRYGLVPDSTIQTFTSNVYAQVLPIHINNSTPLAFYPAAIYDDNFVLYGVPKLYTGISKVTFPVLPGSGYKLYVNTVSETPYETEPLMVYISNCSVSANQNSLGIPMKLYDVDLNQNSYIVEIPSVGNTAKIIPNNYSGRINTTELDIKVPVMASSISIYIQGMFQRNDQQDYGIPSLNPETFRTTRLLSISGALLPIDTVTDTYIQEEFTSIPVYTQIPAVPAYTEEIEVIREISTDSSKYCPTDFCDNAFTNPPEIADGPVVAAQEIYHQRPFDAGVAKSRITLLSDPSLIQGRSIANENGQINNGVVSFLGSLYPVTTFPNTNAGRQYYSFTKIVNPEKLSPQKLVNAYQNSGLSLRFNGSGENNLQSTYFSDSDYIIDISKGGYGDPYLPEGGCPPTYTTLREPIIYDPVGIRTARQNAINAFNPVSLYGASTKFSGIINGKAYSDASIYGGMPEIMKDTGHDYLDFDYFPSGYPGDLFGYSVIMKNNKLYIGAPFAAFSGEKITKWQSVNTNTPTGPTYNTEVGFNGGAGAVYVFEKNYGGSGINNQSTPWGLTKKFRPPEINIGQNGDIIGDQFGYSISLDGDILAIGAPGHDYGNYTEDSEAEFIRKEFNEQFDIQKRTTINLGSQINRDTYGSGDVVQNNGAVFTYENKIVDWGSKTQDWIPIHKLVPQGYMSSDENLSSNDNFGKAIALTRSYRNDSDYSLIVGAPNHGYGSGVSQSGYDNAGAIYSYDGMLRRLRPSFAHPDSFIAGRLFGDVSDSNENPYIYFNFSNSGLYNHYFYFHDTVYANDKGELFIEVSGQDKIPKGFITHRPYIYQINGSYHFGTQSVQYGRLFIEGRPEEISSNMPLINRSIDYGNVYDNVELYTFGVSDINSGIFSLYNSGSYVDSIYESGLTMHTQCAEFSSGIITLAVRGK
ncbi:MAG: hypothetical protein EBU90_05840 [Proteobacteria bacterium]|nr:hypothetical protein [Pseudomonadota bacterium]NBP13701.1 hypothetical protein [bacterium]